MDVIKDLNGTDWFYVFCAIIAALVALKFLWTLIEWFIDKLGLETKKMREKRENRELLIATTELAKTTAENLNKLQCKHNQDEKEFRDNLNAYMEESREDRKALHEEMSKYSENRINDRKQSLEIQKELKDSIEGLIDNQKDRDSQIETLTSLFLEKEISDYRWEIINLADKISDNKPVSKECFKHAISTHTKYEEIIEKYGLTNGEVDISMQIINEAYLNLLKDGK